MTLTLSRRSALAVAAAGALARPATAQTDASRTIRFVPQANLANPDPVWTTSNVARNHAYLVWDMLYGVDTHLTPSPQMCAGHELSDDKRVWRFTLRDGLAFHDGVPVRSADCIASIARWSKRDGFGQILAARTDEMRVVDDKRFEIRLNKPFPLMLFALGGNSLFIMPERMARTDAFKQIDEYVGSGPFRFVRDEWVSGSRALYTRFEGYQPRAEPPDFTSGGKRVNVDRVEWLMIPDPATAGAALQRGEVDWLESPLSDLLPLLRSDKEIRVEAIDPYGVVGVVVFNHLQPPFDNPKLRRALLPAIDQRTYLAAIMGDEQQFTHADIGVFIPNTPLANDAGLSALTGPRDIALARRLVSESGYRGEKVVLLSPSDYPTIQAIAQVTRDVLEKVGVNVEYASMDWGTVINRRASREPVEKGGWSIFCTYADGFGLGNPISNNMIRGAGTQGWFGWPDSPRLRSLRDAWLDAPDLPAQQKLGVQIQEVVFEEVPYLPVGQFVQPIAYRANLSGIVRGAAPFFWGVRKS